MAVSTRQANVVRSHRILHVFRAPVGGLFRHVADLARLQSEAGHKVGIVCDSGTGGAQAEQTLRDLMPWLVLGATRVAMRRNPHPTDLSALIAVRDVAERVRATVLHGHGAKGGLYVRLAPIRDDEEMPLPIRAYTPHGGSYNHRQGSVPHRAYMAAEAFLAHRTDLFLFESSYVAARHRAFVGEPRCQMRVVHNGVGEAEWEPIAPAGERYDLVSIGELREAKGVAWLLEALAALRAKGRPLRLLVVGAGPEAGSLRAHASALGLADAVSFEPPQPIRPTLARGRLLVVPSLSESLPYVVLEAAAAGHPLVATNVGGIPEIFGAFAPDLVPPCDAGALAATMAEVLDMTPEARDARFSALGLSVRERFSLTTMGADVLSGYASAFAARGSIKAAARGAAIALASEPACSAGGALSLP